jgi:hypothetical protein
VRRHLDPDAERRLDLIAEVAVPTTRQSTGMRVRRSRSHRGIGVGYVQEPKNETCPEPT